MWYSIPHMWNTQIFFFWFWQFFKKFSNGNFKKILLDSYCFNDFWILGIRIIDKILKKFFVSTKYVVYYIYHICGSKLPHMWHTIPHLWVKVTTYVVYYTTYVAYYTTNVNSPEIPVLFNMQGNIVKFLPLFYYCSQLF